MSGMLINLIVQIVSGAIGGNVAGSAAKNIDLGTLGNTIAGAIGGGVGGQILGMLIPLLANSASTPDIGSIVGRSPAAVSPVPFSPRSSAPSRTKRRLEQPACIIGSGHLQKSHLSAGRSDCINR